MANKLTWAALALVLISIAVVGAGQAGLLAGSPPASIGVRDGRLAPPSLTPNSVSSQASLYPDHPQRAYASIEPLAFTGDPDLAMQRLTRALVAMPRTTVVEQQGDYLRAEAESPWLRFRDDMEFWIDRPSQVIHVRSASRLGRKDFGANRARVEALRARFAGP